jgi:hypothetical protein
MPDHLNKTKKGVELEAFFITVPPSTRPELWHRRLMVFNGKSNVGNLYTLRMKGYTLSRNREAKK